MPLPRACLAVPAFCLGLISARSLSQTTEQAHRIGAFYAKADGFSGNVVVVRDGTVVSNESFGMASVEQSVANTSKTRFAIGSVSKQFTAAAILLLQEQGRLKTSDNLSQHYPQAPAAWKSITLHQLLQHTSGIADESNVWGAAGKEYGEPTPEQVVAASALKPLKFQPGSRMEYNNTGYILLGLIVEKVSGLTLGEFLQKSFLQPLGMRDTGLASSHQVVSFLASGYAPEAQGLETADRVPYSSVFAAGAMYSTGADLATWLTALHGGRVLKPASYAEMTKANADGYGYGLRVTDQSGQTDISHNGRVPGFASETEYFPKTKTGIIVLSNKLSHAISPGEAALDSDLMHLATDPDAAVRSLGTAKHIDKAVLARYPGVYVPEDPHALPVELTLDDGRLMLTPKDKSSSTLVPRSDHEFYMKEWDAEAEIVSEPNGALTLHIFSLANQTMLSLKKAAPSKQ